jgi:hypothetical protein
MDTTFDPTTAFRKTLSQVKLPGFDITSALEAERKYIDAMAQANCRAYEGLQAILRKQQQLFQQRFHEIQGTLKNATRQDGTFDQTAFVMQATAELFEDMRDLAEVAQHAQEEIWAALGKPASYG